MDANDTHHEALDEHDHDHHEHHELPFLQKYVFSTDHKVIGIQYGISGLVFLLFGFYLMLVMRYSIANPGEAMPLALRLPLMPVEWVGFFRIWVFSITSSGVGNAGLR
jgi:hypothetical protein